MYVNLTRRGHTVSEIWPFLWAKFRGNSQFRKFGITDIDGVYKVWKFEHAICMGSRNTKGGILFTKMDRIRVKTFLPGGKIRWTLSHLSIKYQTRCWAIAERLRCRVRYFQLKVEDWNWKTMFYEHYIFDLQPLWHNRPAKLPNLVKNTK